MLDIDIMERISPGDIFASGVAENSEYSLYMTNERKGHLLKWIAKKGHGYNDWGIYVGWYGDTMHDIAKYGQKVATEKYIRMLVPCTDELFKKYRF